MAVPHSWNAQAELEAIRQQLLRDREFGLLALDALFRHGTVPIPHPDGRHRGEVVALTLSAPLDLAGRAFAGFWRPWLGKDFDAGRQEGENIFRSPGLWLFRLLWPAYQGWRPDGPGHRRGFRFRASPGAAALDVGLQVLRLDYDLATNPRFVVRDVLDELVQLAPGFYLGKALLRRPGSSPRCLAYFSLAAVPGARPGNGFGQETPARRLR
jgi:hypothetical protein